MVRAILDAMGQARRGAQRPRSSSEQEGTNISIGFPLGFFRALCFSYMVVLALGESLLAGEGAPFPSKALVTQIEWPGAAIDVYFQGTPPLAYVSIQ